MIVDLNEKQIEWIRGHITDSNKSIEEDMKKGIHDLNKARHIIEFSDFLKELENSLGSAPCIDPSDIQSDTSSYDPYPNNSVDSSTSLGDPLSDLAGSPDTNRTMEESAKEELEEVKEKAIEDDIFGDL